MPSRARLEIVGQVDAARLPHRGETGQESGDDHGGTGDDERPRVADDRRCCALRQEERPEHGPSPLRHEQAGDASDESDKQAFGEQLRKEAATAHA